MDDEIRAGQLGDPDRARHRAARRDDARFEGADPLVDGLHVGIIGLAVERFQKTAE
jgi:hypothetical protein